MPETSRMQHWHFLVTVFAVLQYPMLNAALEECEIVEIAKCKSSGCSCNSLSFLPGLSYLEKATNYLKGRTCDCDSICIRKRQVTCVHGSCDRIRSSCVCDPCWTGTRCEKYENLHMPKFQSSNIQMEISSDIALSKQQVSLNMDDLDSPVCVPDKTCPCGRPVIAIVQGDSNFVSIDQQNGTVYLNDVPPSYQYEVKIGVSNENPLGIVNAVDATSDVVTVQFVIKESKPFSVGEFSQRMPASTNHRSRRALRNQLLNDPLILGQGQSPLIVSVIPYLTDTYFFNKGDSISYKIQLEYNTTGFSSPVTNIVLQISSDWLEFEEAKKQTLDTFTISGGVATANAASLSSGTKFGDLSTRVVTDVLPLSKLSLVVNVSAKYDGADVIMRGIEPLLVPYAVFPEINVTRITQVSDAGISCYQNATYRMLITFPPLTHTFRIEWTTNIEEYVFMGIKNVTINQIGKSVTCQSQQLDYFSNSVPNLADRAVLNFGTITVSGNTSNTMDITFTITIDDHPLLENGSVHYFGFGYQSGSALVWVEQEGLNISKREPSLALQLASDSRPYTGDLVTIYYLVKHETTSRGAAINLKLTLNVTDLVLVSGGSSVQIGPTYNVYNIDLALTKQRHELIDQPITGKIVMKVSNLVTALKPFSIVGTLTYGSDAAPQKLPATYELKTVIGGAPIINMSLNDGTNSMHPGERRTFFLSILMFRLASSLRIELVMPKANNLTMMHIIGMEVLGIGSNIEGLDKNSKAQFLSTTADKKRYDQAVLDLGYGVNKANDSSDVTANQIRISFQVLLLDHVNVTNGSQCMVGAGVVGEPIMIWIGQTLINLYTEAQPRPRLELLVDVIDPESDLYEYAINISHKNTSSVSPQSIRVTYILPAFVEFVQETSCITDLAKTANGNSFLFTGMFSYLDKLYHRVRVRLVKDNIPTAAQGEDIVVPVFVEYAANSKTYDMMFAKRRPNNSPPKIKGISKRPDAAPHYYGRGFYWDTLGRNIYVCMNQFARPDMPACYMSPDDGSLWQAVDSRVGAILGHDTSNNLYAIGRNQKMHLTNDVTEDDWFLVPATFVPFQMFSYKLVPEEFSDTGDPTSDLIISNGNLSWGGNDEGLYLKVGAGSWKLMARWRCCQS